MGSIAATVRDRDECSSASIGSQGLAGLCRSAAIKADVDSNGLLQIATEAHDLWSNVSTERFGSHQCSSTIC